MQFYHGSKDRGIKELTLSHSKDGFVYAMTSRLVALTFAARTFPNLFMTHDGKECFFDLIPGLFEKMTSGKPGYIYLLENKDFEAVEQSERCGHSDCYRTQESVKVIKKEFVANVYDELMKYARRGEFKVVRHDEMDGELRDKMLASIKKTIKTLDDATLSDKNNFWNLIIEK